MLKMQLSLKEEADTYYVFRKKQSWKSSEMGKLATHISQKPLCSVDVELGNFFQILKMWTIPV